MTILSPVSLEDNGRRFARWPINSEQDLESYERFAMEDHVHNVTMELSRIPNAQHEFQFDSGVWFDNYAGSLDEVEADTSEELNPQHPRPDQFCIH